MGSGAPGREAFRVGGGSGDCRPHLDNKRAESNSLFSCTGTFRYYLMLPPTVASNLGAPQLLQGPP